MLGGSARATCSKSSTSATASSSGRVGGNGSDILNPADLKSVSSESSDGRLGTGSGRLGVNTTLSSKLDVNGVDANELEELADVNGGEHSYKETDS